MLELAKAESIEATTTRHQLRWIGHVRRMDEHRLPRILLYSELSSGNRPHGAPQRRYKDQIKSIMKKANISTNTWETMAQDRKTWRKTNHEGIKHLERERINQIEEKRRARIERRTQPRPPPTIPCDFCPRMFHGHLGLSSHVRHKHQGGGR